MGSTQGPGPILLVQAPLCNAFLRGPLQGGSPTTPTQKKCLGEIPGSLFAPTHLTFWMQPPTVAIPGTKLLGSVAGLLGSEALLKLCSS